MLWGRGCWTLNLNRPILKRSLILNRRYEDGFKFDRLHGNPHDGLVFRSGENLKVKCNVCKSKWVSCLFYGGKIVISDQVNWHRECRDGRWWEAWSVFFFGIWILSSYGAEWRYNRMLTWQVECVSFWHPNYATHLLLLCLVS